MDRSESSADPASYKAFQAVTKLIQTQQRIAHDRSGDYDMTVATLRFRLVDRFYRYCKSGDLSILKDGTSEEESRAKERAGDWLRANPKSKGKANPGAGGYGGGGYRSKRHADYHRDSSKRSRLEDPPVRDPCPFHIYLDGRRLLHDLNNCTPWRRASPDERAKFEKHRSGAAAGASSGKQG